MVISKTPFRISFFGGGTDYPNWFLKEGGAVISSTIDKYCYITCRLLPPFFAHKYRIVWSHIETVSNIDEIRHPAIREGLKYLKMDNGIGLEIHHQGDLPARAGMGSSSSFAVGLIKALTALSCKMIDKSELARKAIDLEQSVLKENVGSQDQMAAAYGGLNLIHFPTNGDIRVEPITLSPQRIEALESRLMLFYTGTSRIASTVAGDVIASLWDKKNVLREMRKMVNQALLILQGTGSLDRFGELLHENWQLKRSISSVISNGKIDEIYQTARRHGALGGKLLGAGSSGFMLFYAPVDKHPDIKKAMNGFLHVPVKFEDEGSSIIHYTTKC